MNIQSRRLQRRGVFRVESLEDRNLLSTVVPKAVPAQVQVASQPMILKGNFSGTAQVTFTGPLSASVQSSGTGKFSSPLGNSTVQDQHIVNINPSNGTTTITNGVTTITGQNGDKLVLDYTGTGVPNGFGGFNDTYNFTVDGADSTGSFANATGSGVIHASDLRSGSFATGFPFLGDVSGQITKGGLS